MDSNLLQLVSHEAMSIHIHKRSDFMKSRSARLEKIFVFNVFVESYKLKAV